MGPTLARSLISKAAARLSVPCLRSEPITGRRPFLRRISYGWSILARCGRFRGLAPLEIEPRSERLIGSRSYVQRCMPCGPLASTLLPRGCAPQGRRTGSDPSRAAAPPFRPTWNPRPIEVTSMRPFSTLKLALTGLAAVATLGLLLAQAQPASGSATCGPDSKLIGAAKCKSCHSSDETGNQYAEWETYRPLQGLRDARHRRGQGNRQGHGHRRPAEGRRVPQVPRHRPRHGGRHAQGQVGRRR